jgi:hypothetical protein
MPHTFRPQKVSQAVEFQQFFKPVQNAMIGMPKLESQGNRPLQMTFEDHLKALVYFHLEEHHSAQHLLQVLEQDDFARNQIAPEDGIQKSSFSEATNSRGLEQFFYVFENLQAQATQLLPKKHPELGSLIGIDGSLIDATLSMYWADYRKNSKKAKVHVGFDLNQAIPRKVFLTDGNDAERPFVSKILAENQTGVIDRGYQCHKRFDQWQGEDKKFICRIKARTKKAIIEKRQLPNDSIVFFDAIVLLGTAGINQTEKPLRLVGYEVDKVRYWIATNRYDLSAEQIAAAYKLRWDIENFFAWWKRHLKVYHLIARSEHGLMVQILAGLITYLLLAIYCHQKYNEKVSIKRVRQLRILIQNQLRCTGSEYQNYLDSKNKLKLSTYAKS